MSTPEFQVKGGAVPYLSVDGAAAAADFYIKAFGAEDVRRMPAEDGKRMMHVHLYINGGSVMMSDWFPEFGHPFQAPAAFNIHLQVDDVDAWHKRAVEAGCTALMGPEDMFWGDRYGQVKDPFGVIWAMGAPIKA